MIENKNDNGSQNRNLSQAFKELQQIRNNSTQRSSLLGINKKSKLLRLNGGTIHTSHVNISHIIIICVIILILTAILCTRSSFAKTSDTKYEINQNKLDIESIISENANVSKYKEQIVKDCAVKFKTEYIDNPYLPKGEEIIAQEGILGQGKVTLVRSYENDELISESILSKEITVNSTPKIINVGTSDFLAVNKIHIGDTVYLIEESNLKEAADDDSAVVIDLRKSMDVRLLELPSEDWCKVSFDNTEGYIKTSNITSTFSTPDITESNRIQRILMNVNIDMDLNKSTGLTLADYEKIFTGLSQDNNSIFHDNYNVFYDLDSKYNINGIFLAAIAIHESNWGNSVIARDKNNLFGFGAYDRDPYGYAKSFSDYREGIETVCKSLKKYYLNPSGTPIYDDEVASGSYYNGTTVQSVNVRYASDPDWHTKIFKHMDMLYNRLI